MCVHAMIFIQDAYMIHGIIFFNYDCNLISLFSQCIKSLWNKSVSKTEKIH